MLQKVLKGRTLALIAVILALTAVMAQAAATYTYEGTLVEIKDRNITVVNNEEKVVIHAVVPANIHLTPAFAPGDKVYMVLTKTNYGLWNVVKMRKIK